MDTSRDLDNSRPAASSAGYHPQQFPAARTPHIRSQNPGNSLPLVSLYAEFEREVQTHNETRMLLLACRKRLAEMEEQQTILEAKNSKLSAENMRLTATVRHITPWARVVSLPQSSSYYRDQSEQERAEQDCEEYPHVQVVDLSGI